MNELRRLEEHHHQREVNKNEQDLNKEENRGHQGFITRMEEHHHEHEIQKNEQDIRKEEHHHHGHGW